MISFTLAILPSASKGSTAVDEVVPTCRAKSKASFKSEFYLKVLWQACEVCGYEQVEDFSDSN